MNNRVVAAGVAVVMLAACQSPRFNETDAAFVHHMVPHHELGVRMVDTALKNADDVRVRELAFTMGGSRQAICSTFAPGVRPGPFPSTARL